MIIYNLYIYDNSLKLYNLHKFFKRDIFSLPYEFINIEISFNMNTTFLQMKGTQWFLSINLITGEISCYGREMVMTIIESLISFYNKCPENNNFGLDYSKINYTYGIDKILPESSEKLNINGSLFCNGTKFIAISTDFLFYKGLNSVEKYNLFSIIDKNKGGG